MKKLMSVTLLCLVTVISIFPFLLLINMTTHVSEDILKGNILLPGSYLLHNLKTVLASNYMQSYFNSLIVSISSTVIGVFICALSGYALSKFEFKFKKAIFLFIIMTMMVPSQIGLVGYLIEMRFFGLNQTLLPLILVWTTNAFGVFWMTQFIRTSVHTELIESARMDGCGEFKLFIRIVLPVITPAIATLSMVIFLWSWNNYMLPLVLINKESLFTITLSINSLGSLYRTDYAARLTGLFLAILPLITIFVIGSKSFIRGLTAGAVKG